MMRRFAFAAALGSTEEVLMLAVGLLAMVWGLFLETHGGGSFACTAPLRMNPHIPPNTIRLLIDGAYGSGPCGFSPFGVQDGIAGALFLTGLVTTLVVVARNLPRFLSERVRGSVPAVWR